MHAENIIAVTTAGLFVATVVLAVVTGLHVQEKRRERRERATPRVHAWLEFQWRRSVPVLDLLICNVGAGTAEGVKWWFEEVDQEDWRRRVELEHWPFNERKAWGVEYLRPGEEIRLALAGGRDLYAPEGTDITAQRTHYPVKPFVVALRYGAEDKAGEAGTPKGTIRKRIVPRMAYPRNTGAGDVGHRIADALERGPGKGVAWFGEQPGRGMPEGGPRRHDWNEQNERMQRGEDPRGWDDEEDQDEDEKR